MIDCKVEAGSLSLVLVDEWSETVASLALAPPSGEITVRFYNPKTDTFQDSPPTDVDPGETVGLYALGENTSGRTQNMKIIVELYDPDGGLLASDQRTLLIDYPGTIGSHDVLGIASKAGVYTAKVELWAE